MTQISEVARAFFSRGGSCALVGIVTLAAAGCPTAGTSSGGGAAPIDFDDIVTQYAMTGSPAEAYESADLSGPYYGVATYDGGTALSSLESSTFHFSFTVEKVSDMRYSADSTDGTTMTIDVVSNLILVDFVDNAGGVGRAWGQATDTTWSRMDGRMAYNDASLTGDWVLMSGTPPPGW